MLKQLPDLTEDYISKAKAINSRFKGDPSFPLEGGTEAEEGEENPTNEKFREIHRLTYTVQVTTTDCSTPRQAIHSLLVPARKDDRKRLGRLTWAMSWCGGRCCS